MKRTLNISKRPRTLLVLWFCWSAVASAAGDDLLQSLEAEAQKVDAHPVLEASMATSPSLDELQKQRAAFESDLQEHNKGTFAIYARLPERSREEVVRSYVDGASMDEIRQLVINRSLAKGN